MKCYRNSIEIEILISKSYVLVLSSYQVLVGLIVLVVVLCSCAEDDDGLTTCGKVIKKCDDPQHAVSQSKKCVKKSTEKKKGDDKGDDKKGDKDEEAPPKSMLELSTGDPKDEDNTCSPTYCCELVGPHGAPPGSKDFTKLQLTPSTNAFEKMIQDSPAFKMIVRIQMDKLQAQYDRTVYPNGQFFKTYPLITSKNFFEKFFFNVVLFHQIKLVHFRSNKYIDSTLYRLYGMY